MMTIVLNVGHIGYMFKFCSLIGYFGPLILNCIHLLEVKMAERSMVPVLGIGLKGRGFKSHS